MSQNQFDRRDFLKTTSAGVAASVIAGGAASASSNVSSETKTDKKATPETHVKSFYDSLTERQKKNICFDWDYQHPKKGLLRTRTENNWNVTNKEIVSNFYTDEQRDMMKAIYEGMIHQDWHKRMYQQLRDDCGGWGKSQSVAVFGIPGTDQFEFVMTGRHMTLRCDGNTTEGVAFGGPIFYGHAAGENDANHEGNVFWEQAIVANKLYEMLDGKQRKQAEFGKTPREQNVAFRGKAGKFTGIPISELANDQKEHAQKVLEKLLEPYRQSDQKDIHDCLKKQGGLEACHMTFYTDNDIGSDKVWDNWRIEGPSFVWHYRGAPHVHVWVNIAENAKVATNT